jgi:hypothetical protein
MSPFNGYAASPHVPQRVYLGGADEKGAVNAEVQKLRKVDEVMDPRRTAR